MNPTYAVHSEEDVEKSTTECIDEFDTVPGSVHEDNPMTNMPAARGTKPWRRRSTSRPHH